jgi:CxxC motif-containing protein
VKNEELGMRELICIVCPTGCALTVTEGAAGADGVPVLGVTGNRCPRGDVYAREEVTDPRRTVTATCAVNGAEAGTAEAGTAEAGTAEAGTAEAGTDAANGGDDSFGLNVRRVPVKTSLPCPKEKISSLLNDIYDIKVCLPVKTGDLVIENWKDSGINVIATRNIV